MLIKRVLSKINAGLFFFIFGGPVFTLIVAPAIFAQNSVQKLPENEIRLAEDEAEKNAAVWNYDSYRRARLMYVEIARKWQAAGNFRKYSECLRKAAQLDISLNEADNAWQILTDSLAAERKNRNIAGESETLSLMTLVALWRKDVKSAGLLQNRANTLAEQSKQPETMAKAAFAGAEYFYRNQRNFALMSKLQEKSLQMFRESADRSGEARALTMLAYTAVMNNDRKKGQELANEAVELSRSTGDSRNLAFALIASGDAYQRTGNWQEAYKVFIEAESIYPENLDHYEKAILFVRFGFHYETFGDLIQARSYFQKARELFIKIGNLYGNAELASLIGQISLQLGDKSEALKNFNDGLEISLHSKDKGSLGYAYENIGELYFADQDYEKSLDFYQKALTNLEKVGIKNTIASVKEKIGKVYLRQNKPQAAEKFFIEALQIYRDIQNKNGQADVLFGLAQLHRSNRQIEASLREIDECLKLTDFLQGETANKKLKQSFLADIYDRYELYINLLMEMNKEFPGENYDLKALQAAEKSTARAMLENLSLSEANFTRDADAETVAREKEIRGLLNTKANNLTDLLSANAGKNETGKISGEINELENQLEEIQANLKQNSPAYYAIKNPAPFNVEDFQKNVLDDNSLLLEFSFGETESYLWLIGKNETSSYILPPRERIESKIQTLRELLFSREMLKDEPIESYQERIKKADEDYAKTAKQLSDELFGQVAGKFSSKRLIVVPDGNLGYFPVSALPLPGSETGEPVLLSNEVVYEPSASTLSIIAGNLKQTNPASKSLLIFSDPVFTADDPRLSDENKNDLVSQTGTGEKFRFVESLNSLVRLDSSKTEADAIIDILGNSNADNFSGFAANREKLLDTNVSDYKILHFATHGLIDESRPELSGIVLSRFDETGRKLDEFFRLHDIYGMNLKSDLVVLSACNTGIGKQVKGEGLMSLNNAFLSVGAKSVMASFWKVEDGATLELMKNFYGAMANEKITPSKALQKAQIKMWQNSRYKSPFYWAAFTVQGDYKNVPQISGGFGVWIYVLPIAAVLIVSLSAFAFIRRRNYK